MLGILDLPAPRCGTGLDGAETPLNALGPPARLARALRGSLVWADMPRFVSELTG